MKQEPINIVYASDENYAHHMAISMISVERHTQENIKFIVFSSEIMEETKIEIKNHLKSEVEFINIDKSEFEDYPITISYISITTYFRLKILTYLPDISKVIYVDVDAVVGGDVSELWREPLSGKAVGAVIDPTIEMFSDDYKLKVGLPKEHFYFNAGLLVIDLHRLREIQFDARVSSYFKSFSDVIEYQDQDVLNGALVNQVKYLNPRYNYMPSHRNLFKKKNANVYSLYDEGLIKSLNGLVVSHFCGGEKPWSKNCFHDGFQIYESIVLKTAWKDKYFNFNSSNLLSVSDKFKRLERGVKRFLQKRNSNF